MAGERLHDDPVWADVSAFLAEVEAAYPVEPVISSEGGHLAAIARETRRLRESATPAVRAGHRRRSRARLVSAWVFATLLGASAAVGVAGAVGGGPLPQLWKPLPAADPSVSAPGDHSPEAAPSASRQPVAEPSPRARATNRTGHDQPAATPTGNRQHADPARAGGRTAAEPGGLARGHDEEKWATGKPGQGEPGVPGNGRSRAGSNDESAQPGKGQSGKGQPGKGQSGKGQSGTGHSGKARASADQPNSHQRGNRRSTAGKPASVDPVNGQRLNGHQGRAGGDGDLGDPGDGTA